MVLACRPDPAFVWLYCLHYAAEGLMIRFSAVSKRLMPTVGWPSKYYVRLFDGPSYIWIQLPCAALPAHLPSVPVLIPSIRR